jgi:O-antigen/teichoic acid export membrane protein
MNETHVGRVPIIRRFGVRRIFGELGWVGAAQLLTALARFLILTIVARSSPPEMFGSFAFFVGVALVIANLTELGLARTLVRFAGVARGNKDVLLAQEYCRIALKIKLILSILILTIGLIVIRYTQTYHDLSLVRWALAVGLVTSFGPLMAAMFQVQGRYQQYFLACSVDPVRLATIFVLLICGIASLRNLVYVYLLSPAVLVLLWPATDLSIKDLFHRTSAPMFTLLWSFGKWLFLIALLESLWQRLDILMLESLGGPREVGIYSGAYMFMGVAALVTGSVGTVIYPRMAEAHGRKDAIELASQYVASTNLLAYLGLPCVLGVTAVSPELVHIVLGSSYSAAVKLFPWLAVYGLFFVLQMNAGAVFFAVGKPAAGFYILLFLVASGVIGNLWFIPRWHAEGAAAVLAVATALAALQSWIAVASFINTWPDFKTIWLLFLSATLMYLAVRFCPLPFSETNGLALQIVLGILVYFSMVKITCGSIFAPLRDFARMSRPRPS